MRKTLVIDNFDSFTFNLVQYVGALDGHPVVFRNDALTLREIEALRPTHIVISPGPGRPDDPEYFGICTEVIRLFAPLLPILGVCLGHQGIASVFGGKVVRATEIMHGKTTLVHHDNSALFTGVPNPFPAMRYHSLVVDPATLPPVFKVTAQIEDGVIMAFQHESFSLFGVQFHPESVGTPAGKQILANFLKSFAEQEAHK